MEYFIGISRPNFQHGPSASIRAHLFQPYFPVLSAQCGFTALQAKWCRNQASCVRTQCLWLAFLTKDIRQPNTAACLRSSMSEGWSVTNIEGRCHLSHLVFIKLQPILKTVEWFQRRSKERFSCFRSLCHTKYLLFEVIWNRTHVSMQSLVDYKMRCNKQHIYHISLHIWAHWNENTVTDIFFLSECDSDQNLVSDNI